VGKCKEGESIKVEAGLPEQITEELEVQAKGMKPGGSAMAAYRWASGVCLKEEKVWVWTRDDLWESRSMAKGRSGGGRTRRGREGDGGTPYLCHTVYHYHPTQTTCTTNTTTSTT
jgi:hypothetical protein